MNVLRQRGSIALVVFGFLLLHSCMPNYLEKYSKRSARPSAKGPASDITDAQGSSQPASRTLTRASSSQAAERPTVYPVDQQTFRFHLDYDAVWDSALNVLLRNYNVTIVDRQSGIITTEWDTFFLNREVFRNRLSMRIHRIGRGTVDVLVHNNVEKLQDGSQVGGGIGGIWLPAEDVGDEMNRVVQNMAIALNQTPPNFGNRGRVARDSRSQE